MKKICSCCQGNLAEKEWELVCQNCGAVFLNVDAILKLPCNQNREDDNFYDDVDPDETRMCKLYFGAFDSGVYIECGEFVCVANAELQASKMEMSSAEETEYWIIDSDTGKILGF